VIKLVYIGGYGHSGSTLLEYLLTASPHVLACGEVTSVLREHGWKNRCTCGERIPQCPVWGPIFAKSETLEGMTQQSLIEALASRDRGAHAMLIDSSKTAWRSLATPFRLGRHFGQDFQFLHLVRDPRAVSWSAVKKAARRGSRPFALLRCAIAALAWSIANLACEVFSWRYPGRYLRVRYEDVARSPRKAIGDLLARLAPGLEWHPDQIGAYDNRHQLYGNRMRSEGLSLRDVKEDRDWTRTMPGPYRSLVSLLTAPLRRRYGYW
jgi:sulfotransferase family protein